MIEASIAILCDYIRVASIVRDNEDATRYERDGVEIQGVVEKAGVLTVDISNDMEKVIEDQIARANDISAQRLHNDLLHACGFVETLITRMDPYLNRTPPTKKAADNPTAKKPTTAAKGDRPSEVPFKDVPDNRYIIEYPKSSKQYYILDCPICEKNFDVINLLYSHINVSHQGIFSGQKSYMHALDVGGTRVTGPLADRRGVLNHNDRVRAYKNVSSFVPSENFSSQIYHIMNPP